MPPFHWNVAFAQETRFELFRVQMRISALDCKDLHWVNSKILSLILSLDQRNKRRDNEDDNLTGKKRWQHRWWCKRREKGHCTSLQCNSPIKSYLDGLRGLAS